MRYSTCICFYTACALIIQMCRSVVPDTCVVGGKLHTCPSVLHHAEDLVLKQALVKFCTHEELIGAFRHKVTTQCMHMPSAHGL